MPIETKELNKYSENVFNAISKYYNSQDDIDENYEEFCKKVDAYFKLKIEKKFITPEEASSNIKQLKYDVYSYKNDNIEPKKAPLNYM